ncbi:MAG: UvrD-helicase domain-containing protein [Candidatus Babeliales bacterium]|jgi:DNA helicase-2/ATP-dependent DNA helicase PcrA
MNEHEKHKAGLNLDPSDFAQASTDTQAMYDENDNDESLSSQSQSELRTLFSNNDNADTYAQTILNDVHRSPEAKAAFNNFVQGSLNQEQKSAVTPKDGSFLVIAGAGSGKTRVITARITNLILNHGVEPSSIIALTFTNKAAQEMQHRIEQFLPNLRTKPTIATFHAYCLKLLKKNAALLQAQPFSVIDSADGQKLLQSIIKDRGLDKLFNPKQLLPLFSSYKMADTLHQELPVWNMHHAQQFMELYNAYEQQKKLSSYLDFDDLLYKTFHLFESNPQFKQAHIQRHRHILVDEYQDTNLIQHELLKQMTLQNNQIVVDSICAVGDEDQSIYSWRGATVKNILEFNQEFKNTQTVKLEQNYRSTQQILNIANSIIKNNVDRNHKQLWSASTEQHQPLLLECLSDLQEAYSIAHLINLIAKKEKKSSIAILYRTHYQSRIIEEALIKESIAYKIIGGIQFYERKEIKDLLAYLRLLKNPFDRISFFRAINCPLRGLGEKFEETFLQTWNENPFSTFQEVASIVINCGLIPMKQIASVQSFVKLFKAESFAKSEVENSSSSSHDVTTMNVTSTLEHFIKQTQYISYLQESFDKAEAEVKRENVAEFLRAAEYFDEHTAAGLLQFLDDISLMQEQIKKDDSSVDRVSMMTLHSAKGLEFPTVILVGLEEGILPSNQSIGQENVQEERRLFYVGITRACQKLLITHSKFRNVYGKMDQQRPSRFLSEIPQHLMIQQEAAHWSRSSFSTFFEDWIGNRKAPKDQPVYQPRTPQTTTAASVVNNNTATQTPSAKQLHIRRLQAVKHATFGLGIAHHVEQKGDKTFVTVHFTHHGTKKIDGSFLQII